MLKKILKSLFDGLIILLITFTIIDGFSFLFLKFYNLNNVFPYLKTPVRVFYKSRDREIIQFQPKCAIYDENLTYRLKAGSCKIDYREVSAKYDINKAGLRDDEASLIKPNVIVLGDSHAMGWAIGQDKVFSSIIEKKSDLKVLNAGISSYGTAREYLMLKELDKSNLEYLVIQYCNNDGGENQEFVKNNYQLDISSKEKYQKVVDDHLNRARYKPFDFSRMLIKHIARIFKGKYDVSNSDSAALNALKIINKMNKIINKNTKIILFEVNGNNYNNDIFANNVKKLLNEEEFKKLQEKLVVIDASKFLTDSDYYILDDHLNSKGHEKIADKLMGSMKK